MTTGVTLRKSKRHKKKSIPRTAEQSERTTIATVIQGIDQKTPVTGNPSRANKKTASGSVPVAIYRDSSLNPITSPQALAKVRQNTQSTKNKIKKFWNGEFSVDTSSIDKAFIGLGKMFAMQDKGGSRYTTLQTNKGDLVEVRLSDHKANGNNFAQDHADRNVSIVIERKKYNTPQSDIVFEEATIPLADFEKDPQKVVRSIVNGVSDVLQDKAFSLDYQAPTAQPLRKSKSIAEVNRRFNQQLQRQIDGTLPVGHIYRLGMPSDILLSTGVPNLPIELAATRLTKKSKQDNHPFDIADLANLPQALQNPVAIFRYKDSSDAQNIIVELEHNGKNFLVGLFLDRERRWVQINDIRGLFPKDTYQWLYWIKDGKALYIDKEKTQALIDKRRINLAEVANLDLDSVAKVIQNFDNPKSTNENSTIRKKKREKIVEIDDFGFKEEGKPIHLRFRKTQSPIRQDETLLDYARRVAQRPAKEQENGERMEGVSGGIRFSKVQAEALLDKMERNAVPAVELELTQENWEREFGKDNSVQTPIGVVKMQWAVWQTYRLWTRARLWAYQANAHRA